MDYLLVDYFVINNVAKENFHDDNVVVLYYGKIVESGPVEDVFSNPQHSYTKTLIDAMPVKHPSQRRF